VLQGAEEGDARSFGLFFSFDGYLLLFLFLFLCWVKHVHAIYVMYFVFYFDDVAQLVDFDHVAQLFTITHEGNSIAFNVAGTTKI
jgi:hypothetical protein